MVRVEHVGESLLYSVKVFVCCLDVWVCQGSQPDICKVFSTSLIHLVQHSYKFGVVSGECGGVNSEVCFHGVHPTDGIFSFSREVCREGHFDFHSAGGGRHGVCWWWWWVGRGLKWGNHRQWCENQWGSCWYH